MKTQPAFYIETKPLEWPVVVEMPVNGGEFAEFRFTGKFARLSEAEITALGAEDCASKLPDGAGWEAKNAAVLHDNARKLPKILIGWSGVKAGPDSDSPEVPFSTDTLVDQILGVNGAALSRGIWRAVNEQRLGMRLGNSVMLPENGQPSEPEAEAPLTP